MDIIRGYGRRERDVWWCTGGGLASKRKTDISSRVSLVELLLHNTAGGKFQS